MIGTLRSKLARLEKAQAGQGQQQTDAAWYSFVARPTCPPSTAISLHGGTCIESASAYVAVVGRTRGLAWTVPSIVRDLTQEDEALVDVGPFRAGGVVTYTPKTWVNPSWYCGGILLLTLPATEENPPESDWKFRLHLYTNEYATATEAETKLIDWLFRTTAYPTDIYYTGNYWPVAALSNGTMSYGITGMPLCGVILRNDGQLGPGRYFLPIDAVDRGRSYTWPRDVRPQWVTR